MPLLQKALGGFAGRIPTSTKYILPQEARNVHFFFAFFFGFSTPQSRLGPCQLRYQGSRGKPPLAGEVPQRGGGVDDSPPSRVYPPQGGGTAPTGQVSSTNPVDFRANPPTPVVGAGYIRPATYR